MAIKQRENDENEYIVIASPGPESETYLTTISALSPEDAVDEAIRMAEDEMYNSARKIQAALNTDMFIVFDSSDMERVFRTPEQSDMPYYEDISSVLSGLDSGDITESEALEQIRELISY